MNVKDESSPEKHRISYFSKLALEIKMIGIFVIGRLTVGAGGE